MRVLVHFVKRIFFFEIFNETPKYGLHFLKSFLLNIILNINANNVVNSAQLRQYRLGYKLKMIGNTFTDRQLLVAKELFENMIEYDNAISFRSNNSSHNEIQIKINK